MVFPINMEKEVNILVIEKNLEIKRRHQQQTGVDNDSFQAVTPY